jgi:hypothetical protein
MPDSYSLPPEAHPEFGYFWPSGRVRRRIGIAIALVSSLAVLATSGPLSSWLSRNQDGRDLGVAPGRTPDAQSDSAASAYAMAPFSNFKPKRLRPGSHPYQRVAIGRVPIEPVDMTGKAAGEIPASYRPDADQDRNVRTITVRDGRGREAPRVFVVPIE